MSSLWYRMHLPTLNIRRVIITTIRTWLLIKLLCWWNQRQYLSCCLFVEIFTCMLFMFCCEVSQSITMTTIHWCIKTRACNITELAISITSIMKDAILMKVLPPSREAYIIDIFSAVILDHTALVSYATLKIRFIECINDNNLTTL